VRRTGPMLGPILALGVALAGALAMASASWAGHGAEPSAAVIRSDYLKRLVDMREPMSLVDLRTPAEYRAGHLPGAINVPITEVDTRYREISGNVRVVLYCDCPLQDSITVYAFLHTKGYRNHSVLEDGFQGWVKQRFPLVR
jgi:rhodanese-related sulfurtransferase